MASRVRSNEGFSAEAYLYLVFAEQVEGRFAIMAPIKDMIVRIEWLGIRELMLGSNGPNASI